MKKLLKTGLSSMTGMYAVGSLSNMSGMPSAAKGAASTTYAGLNLANTGMLAKTGFDLAGKVVSKGTHSHKKKRK